MLVRSDASHERVSECVREGQRESAREMFHCWYQGLFRVTPSLERVREREREGYYSQHVPTEAGQGRGQQEGGPVLRCAPPFGEERLVIYCQTTGVSAAHATHCATYCTPCRPLIRAFSGWIRTPPPTFWGIYWFQDQHDHRLSPPTGVVVLLGSRFLSHTTSKRRETEV